MTNEEAIVVLQKIKPIPHRGDGKSTTHILETISLDMAIKALEQQPCEDCISREQAIKQCGFGMTSLLIADCLRKLPSVTPKAKMGRWVDIQYFKADDTYYRPKCPFCSIEPKEYSNYCPNCGAKMQEVEE